MPVLGMLENFEDDMSADEIADVFELPIESVHAVLAYADAHRMLHRQL